MDAFATALKSKMKSKGHGSPQPTPIADEVKMQDQDLAPAVMKNAQPPSNDDGGDAEASLLKSMGAGQPQGRGSLGLGERAKEKMNERMASIMKNKKKKA